MRTKRAKRAAQVILVVILVGFLLVQVSWSDVLEYIIQANKYLLAVYVVLYTLGVVLSSFKWRWVAGHVHHDSLSLWFYVRVYVIGTFINNFLPSFVGGDAYRIVRHAQESGGSDRISQSAQIVLADRLTGLFALVLLASVSVVFYVVTQGMPDGLLFIVFGSVFVVGVGSVAIFGLLQLDVCARFLAGFPGKAGLFVAELVQFRQISFVLRATSLGVLFAGIGVALANYMLFQAIGVDIAATSYISVIFVISVLSSLPLSVGNIGVKEWVYILLFGLFAIDPAVCVSVVLLSRFLQMIVSLLAAPLYLMDKKYNA